jgi:putative N6-adenine-specific DNA methylase
MHIFRLSAPCHFGLESVLKYEIKKIGGVDLSVSDGHIDFSGDGSVLARANIRVASAERVRILLAEFYAADFSSFIEEVDKITWEDFVGKDDKFPVKGSALNCDLSSVPRLQATVKKSAVNRLGNVYGLNSLPETGALFQIEFTGLKNVFRIYIDTTGAGLHKRGYRQFSNSAPIKETLASGITDLAKIKYENAVIDPFCGSGTLLIESVYRACNIAPGLKRRFTAQEWGFIDSKVWADEFAAARADIDTTKDFHAYGFDIDPEAIELTLQNAQKAGIKNRITVKCKDVKSLKAADFPQGGIITNPPYGERMLEIRDAEKLYREMGATFTTPAAIISPSEEFEKFYGRRADKKRKLYNGMIKCNLYLYNK